MATLAGSFLQTQINERRKAFFRKHWWRVLAVAVFFGAVVSAFSIAFPDWSVPGWAAIGVVLVIGVGMFWSQFDGTYHLEGARDAER